MPLKYWSSGIQSTYIAMSSLELVEESINAEQTEKMEVFIGENSCEDEEGITTRKMCLRRLFKYADKVDIVLMILGTLGALGDGMATPTLLIATSGLVNTLGNGSTATHPQHFMDEIQKYVLYYVYIGIAVWIAAFLEGFCWTRTAERQSFCIRTKYLDAVLRQEVGFFDKQGSNISEVVTTISKDTFVIQDALAEKVPNFLMNTATFVSGYAASFYLSWRLALAAFPLLVLLVIPGLLYGQTLMGLARRMQAECQGAGRIAEQALSSIRTVYSFVGEQQTMEKYEAALDDTVKIGIKQGLAKGLAIGCSGLSFAIWAFLSWYASILVMYKGESGGNVFATGLSLIMGGLSLGTALPNIKCISEACIAAHRIIRMTDRVPAIDSDDKSGQVLDKVSGEIVFKNVEFVYPSRPHTKIFHNFCLTVPGSQTVALVGSSGSGKSTVIALLERFYNPVAGDIMVDGINIKNLQLKWWRNQIGLVSQEPALFATSIKDNIMFGKQGSSMEDVVAAAVASNAHNFISQLPEGYDTQVGEGGMQMSGGQKQRIAIARALIRNPPILLLDEATSALDTESEKIIQHALHQASMGRTTLVVAHRLSTIQNANLISVVHGGQIIESGPHEELINKSKGAYRTLWNMQQQTGIEEELPEVQPQVSLSRTSNASQVGRSSCQSLSKSIHLDNMTTTNPPMSCRALFCRLLALNAPEMKEAMIGSTCAIIFGAVQPVYAFVLGSMISVFFISDHQEMKSKIRSYALVFFSLCLVSFLLNVVQHYNFAAMAESLTKRIRKKMLAKVLTFEVGWFDQEDNSSGAICSKLANEANVVKSLVSDRISLVIQTLSAVILAMTLGLIVAWRLAILMIAVQPLTIFCFYTRKVLLTSMSSKSGKAQNQGSQMAAEAVANHRTITALCSKDTVLALFAATQRGTLKEGIRQSWLAGFGIASAQSLTFLTWALDFWYGGKLVEQGLISSESVFKTFFILVSTGRVIAEAGSMTSDLAKGSAALKSVFGILDRVTKINPDNSEEIKPLNIQGDIEFRKVSFAYPTRPNMIILKEFSLKINTRSSLALVGKSGSGKSTVIALIERFYDPFKGKITIDGLDVKTLNLRCIRELIALVGQEPTLFGGTIRDNILYGRPNATESEIIEAAKDANAHAFISCLKDGYETYCGERGMQLSGGQKQRIAIARAIIKKPAILLLDEATSALDGQSEKVVQQALDRVMVGRTTVLVAHRLSTIQSADSIAVVQNGEIIEQGIHAELMNKGGAFSNLVRIQQSHPRISPQMA